MADMNKALLAKLGWRILNGEEEAWFKVMRCKYRFTISSPPLMKQKKGSLRFEKGWFRDQSCCEEGYGEKSIMGRGYCFGLTIGYPLDVQCGQEVRDEEREHTGENGGWKWELLEGLLPTSTLLELAGTVINTNREEEDSMGWLDAWNKSFTVRSAYA